MSVNQPAKFAPKGASGVTVRKTGAGGIDQIRAGDLSDAIDAIETSIGSLSTDDISEGSNLYFTDERAQDAIGGMLVDTASIDFTYNDGANTISAAVLPAGVDHSLLANLTTGNPHTQYVLGSILTTKGDLFVRDASAIIRLPAPPNGSPLVGDSSQASGWNIGQDIRTSASPTFVSIVISPVTSGNVLSANGTAFVSVAPNTAGLVATTGIQTIAGTKTFSSAPILNMMTQGSVLFAGSGGLVSQNNSNLYWDDSAGKFSIGTAASVAKLTLVGTTGYAMSLDMNSAQSHLLFRVGGSNKWEWYISTDDLRFYSNVTGTERVSIKGTGNVGLSTNSPSTRLHVVLDNATTAAIDDMLTISHNSTGTPAANFGAGLIFTLESTTTTNQSAGRIVYQWATATDASRKARSKWSVFDTAEREVLRIEADGSAGMFGAYGVAAVVRPSATDDIKDALTNLGWLQGTSASPLNLDGGKLTCGEVNPTGDLNHDGSNIGFFTVAPVARAAALVQTYSTADRTLSAYTSDGEGSAYTGIDNLQLGTPYAQVADLNALRVAYENLRVFAEDLAGFVNSLIDDLQLYGLEQ